MVAMQVCAVYLLQRIIIMLRFHSSSIRMAGLRDLRGWRHWPFRLQQTQLTQYSSMEDSTRVSFKKTWTTHPWNTSSASFWGDEHVILWTKMENCELESSIKDATYRFTILTR